MEEIAVTGNFKVLAKANRRMELALMDSGKLGRADANEKEWIQLALAHLKFMRPIKKSKCRR